MNQAALQWKKYCEEQNQKVRTCRWSQREIKTLVNLCEEGVPDQTMAKNIYKQKNINRSMRAIYMKIRRIRCTKSLTQSNDQANM